MDHTILHPDQVLFDSCAVPPILAGCEHIAGSEKFLVKALELQQQHTGLFDITCDLEDGAPAGGLLPHATRLADIFISEANVYNRVGLRLPYQAVPGWREVLTVFLERAGSRIAYFTLPKVQSLAELEACIAEIAELEKSFGITSPTPLHVLIETFGAVNDLHAIAAIPRVECLDFGLMDFVSQHLGVIPEECMRSPGQFDHAILRQVKTDIVRSATMHGCAASHNVTTAYADAEQTYADASIARLQFGFTRMWSIHPAQIEPVLTAMSPDISKLALSQEIIEQAADSGWAPIALNDTLHDRASFRYHWQQCKRAYKNGRALKPEFIERFLRASEPGGQQAGGTHKCSASESP